MHTFSMVAKHAKFDLFPVGYGACAVVRIQLFSTRFFTFVS